MEEQFKIEIRSNFYMFLTKLDFLHNVFNYAEKYRHQRYNELSSHLLKNDYSQFVETLGQITLNEYYNLELSFTYLLLHSIFTSAYSSFELQLRNIAEMAETNIRTKGIIGSERNLINRYRSFLHNIHKIQSANNNSSSWKKIKNYQEMRNAIIHNGNRLKSDAYNRLKDFLKLYNIHVNPKNYEFTINDINFLKDFFDLIKVFIHKIVKEIAPAPSQNSP